ncbi:MAG TPA: dehydrogenase [Bacteroidales bacterium]|nr:dehydrogenase [Bacteroidales bacterium]HOH21947.1 dehydrogenase [Bacteroidales bacterium]HPB57791.1 dehydrogenase [Bacteroidales bacterium]HPZ03522.1 dehydrogenase [Bacteroidales bacterium]HQB74868.1 dehydrogenase [Bacteroidales bacterium]
MIIRSKAPLRIGLAGGGSDVSPYSDLYGGAILNGTISMYAYATIIPRSDGKIVIHAYDKNDKVEYDSQMSLPIDGKLDLAKGVYNRIVKDYTKKPLSFELTTWVDAPAGSGLGTSSTLVTAILGAFAEWKRLPLGHYDLAHLAYEIERKDLGMAGGKQDQYAATFGGINFMEFYNDDKVIINPLRIKSKILNELAHNMLLFYTDTSRDSAKIISRQQDNVRQNNQESVNAMHEIKNQAIVMKEAILKEELDKIGEILDYGHRQKQKMAKGITTPLIEEIYKAAIEAGSTGGKISGAGGGGFMVFYCPENVRFNVINALKQFGGSLHRYEFVNYGLTTWTIK